MTMVSPGYFLTSSLDQLYKQVNSFKKGELTEFLFSFILSFDCRINIFDVLSSQWILH